jgi:hypothetical protein
MADNTSYKSLTQNLFSRRFGGTLKGTADPLISGYFYVQFENLPAQLTSQTPGLDSNTINKLLTAGAQSITLPGATLNKTTFDALGGLKWHVPTNIDIGDSLSIKFVEMSGMPFFRIFHGWFNMIRDYRTGVSSLQGASYTKSGYASNVIYAMVKPDGVTVEFAAYMTGVFPTKDPYDIFGGDITSVDKIELEQEFSVDYIWVMDDWVVQKAQSLANSMTQYMNTIKSGQVGV